MRALVVGYGSIGVRHARLLGNLGCPTAVVSARQIDFSPAFTDLGSALAVYRPEYVVIANSTDRHFETLQALAELDHRGAVLVEKPLFDRVAPLPEHRFASAHVAYNLRFHPIVRRLKAMLADTRVLSVQAYVGQYLPDWRPGSDYRSGTSASAGRGGGVLRDLSHELDYLGWILGGWQSVAAAGGRVSRLEITSDDAFALLVKMRRCQIVSLQLNYLDRLSRRSIVVNTDEHTIEADLVGGWLRVDGEREQIATERDATYLSMHAAILAARDDGQCTLGEGMETVSLIAAAAAAAEQAVWIQR